MTVYEAICRVDALKFNTFPREEKLRWLAELEGNVVAQVIRKHAGGEKVTFAGFDADADLQTRLLVEAPFDTVYLRWLEAQIDYHNGEYDKFNAAMRLFNAAWENFENDYKQNHPPVSRGGRFRF